MKTKKESFAGMGPFLTLWSTQALSALGSSMTGFALIVWSYQQSGSALTTALLSVCTYAPYVALSLFAGVLSDRWDKRRTMLACDALAAVGTLGLLTLWRGQSLALWHIYALNVFTGMMNTVQQPAAEVAATLLAPRAQFQRVGSLQALSSSLVSILTPALASAVLAFGGLGAVMALDLASFAAAFLTLLLAIRIPRPAAPPKRESVLASCRAGLGYLGENKGLWHLILFLAAINLTASMYEAALPAFTLSRGGDWALGAVNTCAGAATLAGSLLATLLPAPKSRVRVICNTLLVSMGVENLLLAFGRTVPVWCLGAALGWLCIPVMNANLNALLRSHIPVELQGRVYAVRNTFQFFTIPLGYLLGGVLVDKVLEPLLAAQTPDSVLCLLFGTGKGAGAAALFFLLAVLGEATCLAFRRSKALWALEQS